MCAVRERKREVIARERRERKGEEKINEGRWLKGNYCWIEGLFKRRRKLFSQEEEQSSAPSQDKGLEKNTLNRKLYNYTAPTITFFLSVSLSLPLSSSHVRPSHEPNQAFDRIRARE